MKAEAVMKLPVGCIVDYKGSRLFIMNRYEQYNKSTETDVTMYKVKFVYGNKYAMGAEFEYKESMLYDAVATSLIPKKYITLQFEKAMGYRKTIEPMRLSPRVVLQQMKLLLLDLNEEQFIAVNKIIEGGAVI